MLQSMRKHSQSFLIYILFGILIFVFVFMFGLPTSDCNPQTQSVVGETEDYEIQESELRSALMRTFGDRVSNDEEELAALQRQLLYNMLTTLVIAEAAEAAGLRVSDEELRAYITDWERGNPDALAFQVNGQFDRERYQTLIDYWGTTVNEYERYKRRELLARNYLKLFESSISVSEPQIRAAFEAQRGGVNLEYVKIEPRHVEHLIEKPSESDVKQFLADNMDEVKAYYEENEEEFGRPATVHLKEIIIQKKDDMIRKVGSATDKSLPADERFEIVRKAVVDEGVSFVEASEKYNEALVHRDNGGDRGTEEVENLSRHHRDAIEGKKAGEVFTFETELTHNLVKIVERQEAIESDLDKVQDDIARKMIEEKRASDVLDEKAKAVYDAVEGGKAMQEAIDEVLYADVGTPGDEEPPGDVEEPSENGEPTKEDGDQPADGGEESAEAPADDGETAEADTGGDDPDKGDDQPTEAPAGDEGKDTPADGDETDDGDASADGETDDGDPAADDETADGNAAEEAAEKEPIERVSVLETGNFNPRGANPSMPDAWASVPGIGQAPEVARVALELEEEGELAPKVFELDDGSRVVARLKERKTIDDEQYEEGRARIISQLRAARARAFLGDWRSILALQHPDPLESPYGPWIQARFEQARTSGEFMINTDYLGPAGTQTTEPEGE